MKIVHDEVDGKNERQYKYYGKMPVIGEKRLENNRHLVFKHYRNTQDSCQYTKGEVFIGKVKEVLEDKVKREVHRRAKDGCGHGIEG